MAAIYQSHTPGEGRTIDEDEQRMNPTPVKLEKFFRHLLWQIDALSRVRDGEVFELSLLLSILTEVLLGLLLLLFRLRTEELFGGNLCGLFKVRGFVDGRS